MTGQEHEGAMGGLLHGLRSIFSGSKEGLPTAAASAQTAKKSQSVLSDLDQALEQVRSRAQELKESAVLPAAGSSSGSGSTESAAEMSAADQARLLQEVHTHILNDIVALHSSLSTGIDKERLQNIHAFLVQLEAINQKRSAQFEERVKVSILRKVISESAPRAWKRLNALLTQNSVAWPEPSGLAPWSDAHAKGRALDRELAEMYDAFVASTPARIADRMSGIVAAWKENYPAADSGLWKRMVIQGVGYGLLGHALVCAVSDLRAHGEEIRAQVSGMLTEQLEAINRTLREGLSSVNDADQVVNGATQMCEEVVPEVAWKRVRAIVEDALR